MTAPTDTRHETLIIRLATLDRELPRLVAEVNFWRCVIDGAAPRSTCPILLAYRDALLEYNTLQAKLRAMGCTEPRREWSDYGGPR